MHKLGGGHGHLVAGQVVLSEPGSPCLRCMGVVTDVALVEESRRYGAAGGRPQVVWSNGVLATLTVGLVIQTFTPWSPWTGPGAYLSYDGNKGLVTQAERFRRWKGGPCKHYPNVAVGDPTFDVRNFIAGDMEVGARRRGGWIGLPASSAAGAVPRSDRWRPGQRSVNPTFVRPQLAEAPTRRPLFVLPSSAEGRTMLGARLPVDGVADSGSLGEALHAILAYDNPQRSSTIRLADTQSTLDRWRVTGFSAMDALTA